MSGKIKQNYYSVMKSNPICSQMSLCFLNRTKKYINSNELKNIAACAFDQLHADSDDQSLISQDPEVINPKDLVMWIADDWSDGVEIEVMSNGNNVDQFGYHRDAS